MKRCCAHCRYIRDSVERPTDWLSQWRCMDVSICSKRGKPNGILRGAAHVEHNCSEFVPRPVVEVLAETLAEKWL